MSVSYCYKSDLFVGFVGTSQNGHDAQRPSFISELGSLVHSLLDQKGPGEVESVDEDGDESKQEDDDPDILKAYKSIEEHTTALN